MLNGGLTLVKCFLAKLDILHIRTKQQSSHELLKDNHFFRSTWRNLVSRSVNDCWLLSVI